VGEFNIIFGADPDQNAEKDKVRLYIARDDTKITVGFVDVGYSLVRSPLRGEEPNYIDWFSRNYASMIKPSRVREEIISDFSDLIRHRPQKFKEMFSLLTDFMARYSYGQHRPLYVIVNDRYLRPDYICGSHYMFLRKEVGISSKDAAALVFLFHHQTPTYFAYKKLNDGGPWCGNQEYENTIRETYLLPLAEIKGIQESDERDQVDTQGKACNKLYHLSGECFVRIYREFEKAIILGQKLEGLMSFMGTKVVVNLPGEIDNDYIDLEGFGFTKIVNFMIGDDYHGNHRKVGCFRYLWGGGSPGVEFFWKNNPDTVHMTRVDVNSRLQITEISMRRATPQEIRSVYLGDRTFDETTKCRVNFINHKSAKRYLVAANR
jgi:hypothetical protein